MMSEQQKRNIAERGKIKQDIEQIQKEIEQYWHANKDRILELPAGIHLREYEYVHAIKIGFQVGDLWASFIRLEHFNAILEIAKKHGYEPVSMYIGKQGNRHVLWVICRTEVKA